MAKRVATLVLPLTALVSGCATAGAGRSAGPLGEPEAVAERGPRVHIWTRTEEQHHPDRVGVSFRLDDDAYVIVVNVGRDGYANVVFPESPEDDGFMRGGRTYRLPAFFPGFPHHTRSDYGRLYTASSSYDQVYDRYAGYVFVIASWRPMHFQVTEALGLWDSYRLAAHDERLDPYVVMHRFAEQLVSGRSRDYTARFARYAAFNRGFAGQSAFASCSHFGSMFGAYPSWAYYGLISAGWVPLYGYGYYDLGGPGCGTAFGVTVVGFRPRVRVGTPRPLEPTLPPPVDTSTAPTPPDKPPVIRSDSGEKKPHPGSRRRTEVVAERDDDIVDVTREHRERVRREDREFDRARRVLARERGSESADGWRGQNDDWRRAERTSVRHGSGEADAERARARSSSDDNSRVRNERSREESRPVERRESPPPRAEPRSEPRSEPRPQPEQRSEPRAEPRGEKPKP